MFKNLTITYKERICILTINRPEKLNALNIDTLEEFRRAFQKIYNDKSVLGVIITGSGEKAFVAGADINEIANLNDLNGRKFAENGQEVFKMIECCNKPVVAAINGYALGGGCELALACHLRIGSKNAKLGLPEVSLGILPGFGGTQRLTHLIGKGRALEIILSGEMIDAEKAYEYGILNDIFDTPDLLIPAAHDLLKRILKNAPISLGLAIEAVNAAVDPKIDGYQSEANHFSKSLKTKDFLEGTNAFLSKRKPEFKGE